MIHSGARRSLSFGFGPPTARRGFLPLVLAALGAGRSLIGAIQANQTSQRNKGFINTNYRLANANLKDQQAATAESRDEELASRGLLQGGSGSAIATAMSGATGVPEATTSPTDLAGQDRTYTAVQFAREQSDLDLQHDQALAENSADYTNSLIGSAMAGVSTAVGLSGAGADNAAGRTPTAVQKVASTPGLSDAAFGGIHPSDPLGDPSSAWYTPTPSPGQPQYSFHAG